MQGEALMGGHIGISSVGSGPAQTETPMMGAVKQLDVNIGQLTEALARLFERLKVVRNTRPTPEGPDKQSVRPSRSGMVNQLDDFAQKIAVLRMATEQVHTELDI